MHSVLVDNDRMNRLPFLSFFVSVSALAYVGCSLLFSRDEVARVSSPDGRVDAFLFETNGGATTSFGYEVELGSKHSWRRKNAARLYGAVRNAQAYGVDLRWENDHTLVIECLKTETPPEIKKSVDVDGRDVQILLHIGVEDKSAPAGGMLFNLHRK